MSSVRVKQFLRPVTLAVGQTDSAEIDITGEDIIGFHIDANLTGTTFKIKAATAPGGTFVTLQDNSGDLTLTVAASKVRGLSADEISKLQGATNIKITSGTTQATAPSVITIITKQQS